MSNVAKHDLVVIGAGPGGYVAAIRAAQLGLNVGCVEKEPLLGGTCLRVGCIPSKALLESSEQYQSARVALAQHGISVDNVRLDLRQMLKRKDQTVESLTKGVDTLFRKNKVTRYQGHGRFNGLERVGVTNGNETTELHTQHTIIASGSVPAPLKGVELDYERIGTSTQALAYDEVPKRLVVIGAGYIGLELGSVWARLGSEVIVIEYLDRVLPGMDLDLAREAEKAFRKQGMEFRLSTRVTAARRKGKGCVVEVDGAAPIECDRVLLAVGRAPNSKDLGLEAIGLKLDAQGRIPVDDQFRSSVPNVYAIGDVIRGPMLAHKAEEEGCACVEGIVNGYAHVNYNAIPGVVYTEPEIAAVGQTEQQLAEAQVPYKRGVFYFRGNARARALASVEGFCKMLAHRDTDRILGVHIIGPRAGDLIAEAAVAIEFGASAEDLGRASHAHPTLAEVLKEAALAVHERAIHA